MEIVMKKHNSSTIFIISIFIFFCIDFYFWQKHIVLKRIAESIVNLLYVLHLLNWFRYYRFNEQNAKVDLWRMGLFVPREP